MDGSSRIQVIEIRTAEEYKAVLSKLYHNDYLWNLHIQEFEHFRSYYNLDDFKKDCDGVRIRISGGEINFLCLDKKTKLITGYRAKEEDYDEAVEEIRKLEFSLISAKEYLGNNYNLENTKIKNIKVEQNNNNNNNMRELTPKIIQTFTKEERELYKAGLIDDNRSWSQVAKESLLDILLEEKKAELAKVATEIIEEERQAVMRGLMKGKNGKE